MAGMSFDDLPADWPQRPLTEPTLVADVLDLVVSEQSRHRGALYLLLCDDADRLAVPVAIDALRGVQSLQQRVELVSTFLDVAGQAGPLGSVLAAVARTGGLSTTADDRSWARAVAVATAGRARLLGVHVVTPRGSRPVQGPVRGVA